MNPEPLIRVVENVYQMLDKMLQKYKNNTETCDINNYFKLQQDTYNLIEKNLHDKIRNIMSTGGYTTELNDIRRLIVDHPELIGAHHDDPSEMEQGTINGAIDFYFVRVLDERREITVNYKNKNEDRSRAKYLHEENERVINNRITPDEYMLFMIYFILSILFYDSDSTKYTQMHTIDEINDLNTNVTKIKKPISKEYMDILNSSSKFEARRPVDLDATRRLQEMFNKTPEQMKMAEAIYKQIRELEIETEKIIKCNEEQYELEVTAVHAINSFRDATEKNTKLIEENKKIIDERRSILHEKSITFKRGGKKSKRKSKYNGKTRRKV